VVKHLQKKEIENETAVILGFYNGHVFIKSQLKSIFNQTHCAFHIFLYDDKSTNPIDLDSLKIGTQNYSKISIQTRRNNFGFANNFLNALLCISDEFEYFAFSDQDDVWYEDKLESAIDALKKSPEGTPALYCGRTEITDAACERTLGFSPLFNKPPSFANAIVQNIGGGNTMVLNRSAKDLMVKASMDVNIVSHDWWCYQIITGAGGYVVYDKEPCLKYRQHESNLIGSNNSWRARLARICGLFRGRFRRWNDINLKALSGQKHLLTSENRKILNDVIEARQSSLFKRLYLCKRSGINRQTLLGNFGLFFAVLLNRV